MRRRCAEEIAAAVGFQGGNSFIRCFKRHTGQTPMQYRRLISGKH